MNPKSFLFNFWGSLQGEGKPDSIRHNGQRIWGLGERQIQKILKRSDESALGADDFAEFVVILQRISNRKDKKR